MLLAHPNHLTHGGRGLNDPTGKRDREIVPIVIYDFVRIPFYSLAPYPSHAKPCFTSRCAIKAPSKEELGSPTSEYSNPLSTTTTALAALNYGSISVLMYITKAEFGPKRLISSSIALPRDCSNSSVMAKIFNRLRHRKIARPILPLPSFWLVCARAFEHALLCGCLRPNAEQKATEAEPRPRP